MPMSKYLFNKLIDHIFRAATFSKPTHLYMALFTTDPTITGSGTEVSGGSYARVLLDPADANYLATQGGVSGASSGSVGTTSNATAFTFPAPTGNWGTAAYWGVFDASTSGNLLFYGPMQAAQVINSGDPAPVIPIGGYSETLA